MDSGTHFEILYGCLLRLPILNNCLNGQVLELRQNTDKGQYVLAVVKEIISGSYDVTCVMILLHILLNLIILCPCILLIVY